MRLITIGCEYTGKTTLMSGIRDWLREQMNASVIGIHDHFLPFIGEGRRGVTPEEEAAEFLKLQPFALEMYLRYMSYYHHGTHFYTDDDHLLVNWYFADAVYADLYCGFGGPGAYADRRVMARSGDAHVMESAPDTVLLHLTAGPDVIRERMAAERRPHSLFQEQDIDYVCQRFTEEFQASTIRRKVTIDTSTSTANETLKQALEMLEPHFTTIDRLRLVSHQAMERVRTE